MGAHIITKSDTAYLTGTVITPVNESAQATTVVDETTDTFTIVAHGWAAADKVKVTVLGDCDGIVLNGEYFIVNVATDTFKVSATVGGSAIDVTATVSVFPSFKRVEKRETKTMVGDIYVGVTGIVMALLATSPNTNSTTPADLGAVVYKGVPAGAILKGPFRKVFSTTTTATDMLLITPE